MNRPEENSRKSSYKANPINPQESRVRRHEVTIELRKSKREEQMFKRRNITIEDLDSPPKEPNGQSALELSMIVEIVSAINSEDLKSQFRGMQSARTMLSRERSPPIDLLISHGIVPKAVRFLQNNTYPMLQFEAAWALTNIASGTSDQTRCVIEQNAVPHFISLLTSQSLQLAEQSVWALSNIAGDGPFARDIVINNGVIDAILRLMKEKPPPSYLRHIVWLMSNLCRNKKPPPPFQEVKRLLPILAQLLLSKDIEVLADACWALSYVTDDDDNTKIQAVVDTETVVPTLINLLQMDQPSVIVPALRSVGNIVTGTDQQTDLIIANGGLPRLGLLLQHQQSNIVKEAAWAISNITAGNPMQIQAVIEAGIFIYIKQVLEKGDCKSQKEAAWAVTNTTNSGTPEQIIDLIEKYKILKPFMNLLDATDPSTIKVVLNGLMYLFNLAEQLGGTENLCLMVEEMGGLDKLEALQQHENDEIFKKAYAIIDTFFNSDAEGAEALELNATDSKIPDGSYTF